MIENIITKFEHIGFSGSRKEINKEILELTALNINSSAKKYVGCAKGVDEFFRVKFPEAKVFSVASGQWGYGKPAFARRSAALVEELKINQGLLLAFPNKKCPTGLKPNKNWISASGSGTWGTIAVAIGNNVNCLIFTNFGVPSNWKLVVLNNNWFSFSPDAAATQLSLF